MFRKSKDALEPVRRGQEEVSEEGVPAGVAESLVACRKGLLLLIPVAPHSKCLF